MLTGRLTKDPEIRYTQGGAEPLARARYSLAVRRARRVEGEPDADFIFCVAFGKQAEFAEKYLKKGMLIAVSGRLSVYALDDQSGQKRWYTDVIVDDHEFLESKAAFENRAASSGGYGGDSYRASAPAQQQKPQDSASDFASIPESIDDDDLPF
jgi:single-strand DNA-binding protein